MSFDTNTHVNLAAEECLYNGLGADEIVLFLWQSLNSVVIGRNQNAWRECNLGLMMADGVCLARRFTGGGAVYQDLGNLNFCFAAGADIYDAHRQTGVVLRALASLNVDAQPSGRNDIAINGRKVSGQAYRNGAKASLHHGTLLIRADIESMGRYLNVSQDKLKARGVDSVRARVENLSSIQPHIDKPVLCEALLDAFQTEYGACGGFSAPEERLPAQEWRQRIEFLSAYEWNYGRAPDFDLEFSHRFDFGSMEFCFTVREGCIDNAGVYTDALDTSLCGRLEKALRGAKALPQDLGGRVRALSREAGDAYAQIAAYFMESDQSESE